MKTIFFLLVLACLPLSLKAFSAESYYCKETNFIEILPNKKSVFSDKNAMKAEVDNSPSKPTSLVFIPKSNSAIIHGNNRSGEFKVVGTYNQYIEIRPDGHANLWTFFPAKENKLNKNLLILEKAFSVLDTPFAFIYVFECTERS